MSLPTYVLEVAFAAPPALDYAAVVAADSPTGYWRLDTLAASAGSAGSLTENAGPISSAASLLTTDTSSVSRDLNGSTQYYTVADGAPTDLADVFSLECWILPTDTAAQRRLFDKGTNAYCLVINTGGAIQLQKSGVSVIVTSTTTVGTTSASHVVATKNGSTVKLYINGQDVTGVVTNATCADTATALHIGRQATSSAQFFDGPMDEIAIYATELSPARVLAHYEAGNPTWTNVSQYLQAFTTRHGKQRELGTSDAGTCTVRLNNSDRRFDPTHTSSPYYPNVLPIRQMRLRAIHNGVTYGLFRGYVQSWPQTWDGPNVGFTQVDCVDGFLPLSKADVGEGETWPAEYGGARIGRILDAAGWPASLRDLDTGRSLIAEMTVPLGSGITALQAILEVADTELGSFFIDADGVACFHDRHRRRTTSYLTSTGTFGDANTSGLPYTNIELDTDDDGIANDIQVTAAEGMTQRAQDTSSQESYWRRTIARNIPLARTTEAADQAAWLLTQNKDPRNKLRTVELKPGSNDTIWAQVLSRDVSDHIVVNRWPQKVGSTITQHCSVEYVEHSATGAATTHTTKWMLSTPAPSAVDWWILGDATYGVEGTTTKLIY